MFTKLSKHRKFDYTPLFYDPAKEEREHPRIHFRRLRSRRKSYSLIWLIALLFLVIYLIIALSKIAHNF